MRRRSTFAAVSFLAAPMLASPTPAGSQQLDPGTIRTATVEALPDAVGLYRALLSLPNDAHRPDDILRLVEWIEGRFAERGFTTERLPTAGSPLLLAERRHPGARGTVLVYLQADGQPVDPSEWNQDSPWIPVVKDRREGEGWSAFPWERLSGALEGAAARAGEAADPGEPFEAALARLGVDPGWRVFVRSASDSKGPIAQFLSAVAIADELGVQPDFDLKVIVDTEEEMGSPRLPGAVQRFRERLAADMLVIFDGPPHVSGRPTLKFGARGIATVTLTTWGPRAPQHSGHYGNYAPNPAFRLSRILASLKDEHGRVIVPGWYDGVELDEETRRILARVPDDEAWIMERLGIAGRDSVGASLQEAVQYPSLNVRGMRAGWVGDEARTIVPATAVAELDVRLVRESDPERLIELLREHVEALGYTVLDRPPTEDERLAHPRLATFTAEVSYAAFRTDFDSTPGRWLRGALSHLHGEEPILIRTSGGSIPISPFVETLGVPAVSVPTVNPDNNQHSPNENLRVGSFAEGVAVILAVLGQPLPGTGT